MKNIFLSPYNRQSSINISYRPIRIAFLMPFNDKDMFLKIIKINCSLWGGAINILIPYEKIDNELWAKTLLSFMPDNMIVPNLCDEAARVRLKLKFDLFHVETMDDFLRNSPPAIHFGVHMYSLLEQEKYYFDKEKRKQVLFFDFNDSENKLDLSYVVTFGLLGDGKLPAIPSPSFRDDLAYDVYANFLTLQKTNMKQSAYLDYFISWSEMKFNSLFDYTMISKERFSQSLVPTNSRHLEEAPLIILTNDILEDYILASNLRYKIINNYISTPIIIRINNQHLAEELSVLTNFLKEKNCEYCNVFSLSCSEKEIENFIANSTFKFKKIDVQRVIEYLTTRWVFSHNSTELCVLQKHMNLLLKKPQFFDSLNNYDYFMTEIKFNNYQVPYKSGLNDEHWSSKKITSEGFKILSNGSEDENLFLMIPDVDGILYTLMVKKEIWPKETAIRRKMKAISSYFESFWEVDIFSTKELQKLFFELKSPSPQQFKTTNGFNHGDICRIMKDTSFKNKFPNQLIDYFILELIKKRILFRGLEVCCPNCHLREWKLLDELKNQNQCSGCGGTVRYPDLSKTHWTYKLNRLFAESFDLTIFLTLMRLVGFKHQDLDKVVGYNFGFRAEIKNVDLVQKLKGKNEIEIDFAIIENGAITIGESKQNPKDFTEEIVLNTLEFAKYINCDKLIFSSLGNLGQLKNKTLTMKNIENLKIEVLDENDLCYLSAYLSRQIEDKIDRGKNLQDISARRDAFIEQFLMISKDRSRPEDAKVIGDYFDIH